MYKGKEDTDEMDHPEDVRLEHDIHLLLVPVFFVPQRSRDIVAICCSVGPRSKVQEIDDKGEESKTQHRDKQNRRNQASNGRGTKAKIGIKGCTHTSPTWSRP